MAVATTQQTAEQIVRPPRRRRGLLWVALFLLMTGCLFALYRSAMFRLDHVVVTGAKHLTPERIMELGGLAPGIARWERPASGVATRLKAEAWVKSATVRWNWNQVEINVQERFPTGLIHYSDLYYLTLDDSGVILEQTDLKGAQGLPLITGPVVTKALRGQQLSHLGLADALRLLSRIAQPLRDQVSEVHVDEDRSLTLFMASGATVLWGTLPTGKDSDTVLEKKIIDFGGYWKGVSPLKANQCRIDLRVDGKAFYRGCQ